nr:MAG TPA: hypothetical protein [Caudoviricetes sp.]
MSANERQTNAKNKKAPARQRGRTGAKKVLTEHKISQKAFTNALDERIL